MSYNPNNPNGQATSANSAPVVISSDQSAVPVSGTVTATNSANGGTGSAAPAQATQVGGSDGTNLRAIHVSAGGVVSVDASGTVLNTNIDTVSGNVVSVGNGIQNSGTQRVVIASDNTAFSVNAVQSTSPWVENVSQFGGSAVVTGTGASGAGIPRVTVSNDSTVGIAAGTNAIGTLNPTKGTFTDNSGSTSGTPSTSTTLMTSNASRKYLLIQNLSSSQTIWINFTSAATAGAGSLPLLPFASFCQEANFISTEAITVLSTGASVPYTAKQA